MRNDEIRTLVRSLYDMQKLRIQNGNRIVAAFRVKLGLESSQAEETDKEAKKFLDDIRSEFKRVTDGVKRVTRKYKVDSPLITSYCELKLIESYELQLEAEQAHQKGLESVLVETPLWINFLKGVHGVGPLMAGVCLSEIDIEKCNSISALWAYAGLDVVVYTDPETGEIREEGRCRKKEHLVPKTYTNRKGEIKKTVGITFNPFLKTKMVGVLGPVFVKLGGPYRDIYDDYKHRLANHPKHRSYFNVMRGEEMVGSFPSEEIAAQFLSTLKIESPDTNYTVKISGKTPIHRHRMAVRYMIKEFLADLWTAWRTMEGLPVRPRYSEEKLGIIHSKPRIEIDADFDDLLDDSILLHEDGSLDDTAFLNP